MTKYATPVESVPEQGYRIKCEDCAAEKDAVETWNDKTVVLWGWVCERCDARREIAAGYVRLGVSSRCRTEHSDRRTNATRLVSVSTLGDPAVAGVPDDPAAAASSQAALPRLQRQDHCRLRLLPGQAPPRR